MEERDWYDTPLYYDIIFDVDTPREADFLETLWHRHGLGAEPRRRRHVLEPACGSGRLLRELARRGWQTAGFDANPRTLDFARDRLRADKLLARALLWEDRMEAFGLPGKLGSDFPGFDLAHCLVSSFKYLPTDLAAESHLRLMAEALRPGGIYILGIHLTDYGHQRCTHERWVAERDGIHVVCNTRTWPPDRRKREERMRARLRVTFPGTDRPMITQETHWAFRTYDARQAKKLLKAAPDLEVAACYDFHHDPDRRREFDDSYADIVLVLRRRLP